MFACLVSISKNRVYFEIFKSITSNPHGNPIIITIGNLNNILMDLIPSFSSYDDDDTNETISGAMSTPSQINNNQQ